MKRFIRLQAVFLSIASLLLLALRHGLRRHWVSAMGPCLLLLQVCLVLHCLLLVWREDVGVGGHAGSARCHAGCRGDRGGFRVRGVGGRFSSLDTVAVGRFGGVEAGLKTCVSTNDQALHSRRQMTYLNEIFALGLGYKRLEFGCGEGVDETSLGNDEQQYLSAGEDGQLVCLLRRR